MHFYFAENTLIWHLPAKFGNFIVAWSIHEIFCENRWKSENISSNHRRTVPFFQSSVIMSDKELGWALKNGDIDKVKEIIESNVSLDQIVDLT